MLIVIPRMDSDIYILTNKSQAEKGNYLFVLTINWVTIE